MTLNLSKVGSATSSTAFEIPAFDPISDRLFVVAQSKVDVYTVSNTGALTAAGQLVLGFTLPIVKDVVVQGDANRTFRLVTLSFLAGTTLTTPTNTLGGIAISSRYL